MYIYSLKALASFI